MKKLLTLAIAASALFMASAQDKPSDELMDKLYPQIMQASQANDHALTKSLIEQLIDAGVDISELETAYAYALAGTGNLQRGIDRLGAYINAHSQDYLAYQALGELYSQAGDEAKALANFETCSSLNPGYARPYVTMARMMSKKDKNKAMANYNKAIRLFIDANQPNGAVQLGVEAMEVDPADVTLLASLGDALLLASMPDKALSFYNESIARASASDSPDFKAITESNLKIAKIYYDKGEYDAALTYLDILIDNEKYTGAYKPTFAEALDLAASCSEKIGDAARASQYRGRAADFSKE